MRSVWLGAAIHSATMAACRSALCSHSEVTVSRIDNRLSGDRCEVAAVGRGTRATPLVITSEGSSWSVFAPRSVGGLRTVTVMSVPLRRGSQTGDALEVVASGSLARRAGLGERPWLRSSLAAQRPPERPVSYFRTAQEFPAGCSQRRQACSQTRQCS
jgi:hypothetical protein